MRKLATTMIACLSIVSTLLFVVPINASDGLTTVNYGNYTLDTPYEATHWDDFWDLTKGDLILSYTINMSTINQPGTWNTFVAAWTTYVEVGLRGEGAGNFNPGPFDVYQGRCGGWMTSDSDTWADSDGYTEKGAIPDSTQDLDDKHALSASGGRGERDYDVLLSNPDVVGPTRQDPWYPGDPTKVIGAYGSFDNFGIWFDRDGVDQWQATSWGNLGPGGVGSGDGLRYNTNGIYHIVITYHAIDANGNGDKTDDGLGVMFATVNGYPTGFYTSYVNGEPQLYPVGLSFKGDMEHMQVFAGIWAPAYLLPEHDFGYATLTNIQVEGYLGTSDPLVADFTYTWTSDVLSPGDTVTFTDGSHGGMPPYTYLWNFGDGTTSTEQNPSHVYDAAGSYDVTLTVTPFRCVPKTVTKTITVVETGYLTVIKFYDANANGLRDADEPLIPGWKVDVGGTVYDTPALIELPIGDYTVTEIMPLEDCWINTTPSSVDVTVDAEYEPMYATGFTVGDIVSVNFDPYNPTSQIDRLNPSNALGPFDATAPSGVSDYFFATGARTWSHYTFADKFWNVLGLPDIEFAEVTWGTGGSWHTEAMKVYLTGATVKDADGNLVEYGATDDGIGYYAGIAWNRIGLEYIDDATRLAVTESYFSGTRNFANNVFYRSGPYGTYTQFHLPDEVVYAEGVYLVDITADVYNMAYPATYLDVSGTGALVTLNSTAWDVINYDHDLYFLNTLIYNFERYKNGV
jgi:PKD repeat protein